MTEDKREKNLYTEIFFCPNCGELINEIPIDNKDDILESLGQPHYTVKCKTRCLKCGHELDILLAVQDTYYGK